MSGIAEARENCKLSDGERVCAGGNFVDVIGPGGGGDRTSSSFDESGFSQETTGGFGNGGEDQREESGGCGGRFLTEDDVNLETQQGKKC